MSHGHKKRGSENGPAPPTFASVYGGLLARWPSVRDVPAWERAVAPIVALYSPDEAEAVVAAWHLGGVGAAALLIADLRGAICPFRFARIRQDSPRETAVITIPDSDRVWTFRRYPSTWTMLDSPEVARRCLVESARDDRYDPVFEMRIDLPQSPSLRL